MKNQALKTLIEAQMKEVLLALHTVSEEEFTKRPTTEKWSIAENLAHLTFSAKVFNKALNAPKIYLWYKFGKRKIGSRPFNEIKDQYYKASFPAVTGFEPRMPTKLDMSHEIAAFERAHQNMIKSIDQWNDAQLDTYLLPQLVLGKLTVREMTQFMAFHMGHHLLAIKAAKSGQ